MLAILTLAVASGALAIVFTVVNAVLVRPLPIRDAERVAIVWERRKSEAGKYGVSGADFFDWQRGASRSVEWMTAQDEHPMILGGSGGVEPEKVMAILSTPEFLGAVGVQPILGSAGDARGGAMLSNHLWQRRFGGSEGVIGKKIVLDGVGYEVAGVLPANFRMLLGRSDGDVYLPLDMPAGLRASRDDHSFLVTARLRAGHSFDELRGELNTVNARLQHDFPQTNGGHDALVVPLNIEVTGTIRPALLLLLGAVLLLMVLGCANVANLLLARNVARSQEIAIRQALGASWMDAARLVLAESLILSIAAGFAGLIVARIGVPVMQAIVPLTIGPVILPGMDRLEIDASVVAFSAGVCGVMALLCAFEPLRRLRHETWRFGASTTGARRLLAAAQIAIACTLLTSAAAFVTSYGKLMRVAPGFAVEQRQVVELSLGSSGTHDRILESIAGVPGVRSEALTSMAPGAIGGPRTGIRLATDAPARSIEEAKKAFFRIVTPGFMRTAGIGVLRGREFERSDSVTAGRVMMVSRTLAERYFAGQDLVGRAMMTPIDDRPWMVVGVVDDIHQLGLDSAAYPEMYFPVAQWVGPLKSADLVIETGRSLVREAELRRAIATGDASVAIGKIRTMSSLVDESGASRYFETALMTVFAAVALWIAVSGLYAVIAYCVESRRRELAVRLAIGATPRQVAWLVVREGALLGALGCGVGVCAAVLMGRFLGQFLFGVEAGDPLLLGGSAGVLFLTTVAACLIPGARAGRLAVAAVLRGE